MIHCWESPGLGVAPLSASRNAVQNKSHVDRSTVGAPLNTLLGDPVAPVRPTCCAGEPAASPPGPACLKKPPRHIVVCAPQHKCLLPALQRCSPPSFPGDPATLVGTSFPPESGLKRKKFPHFSSFLRNLSLEASRFQFYLERR